MQTKSKVTYFLIISHSFESVSRWFLIQKKWDCLREFTASYIALFKFLDSYWSCKYFTIEFAAKWDLFSSSWCFLNDYIFYSMRLKRTVLFLLFVSHLEFNSNIRKFQIVCRQLHIIITIKTTLITQFQS